MVLVSVAGGPRHRHARKSARDRGPLLRQGAEYGASGFSWSSLRNREYPYTPGWTGLPEESDGAWACGSHCRIYLAGEINLAEVFCKSFPDILVLHLVHCINLAYLCQISYLT